MDRDQSIIGIIVVFIILMLLFFATGMFGGGAPGGGGGGGGGGAGVPCAGSLDCPAGQICLNGLCVPAGSCGSDSDCPAGSLCVNGMCSDSAECSAEVPCPFGECLNGVCTGCGSDSDCAPGEICLNNVCTSSGQECGGDSDCPAGFSCVGGVCTQSECSSLVSCPEGQECVGGVCQDLTCPDDFTCTPPEVCQEGSCVEPECGPGDECPPGMDCNEDGECEPSPCESGDECPPGMECIDGFCMEAECLSNEDCPPGQECNDEGFCFTPCISCESDSDCGEGTICSRHCCAAKAMSLVTFDPFGTYSLMPISFCDGCPAQDSLVTRMFLDPKLEQKQVGVTLFVEADDGTRPAVEQGTIFVQILSLDMENKKYCKMATNENGNAYFNYSSYEFCEDDGCRITFTFCCADVSEGCLIPICLNDPLIQDLSDVPTTCPTGSSGGGISIWPTQASVDGEFSNLYPSIDSVSIPPTPKLMGMEFAFQLCFPILVIFGLLSAAMFASGRNPFEMFSLYTPRYKRSPERAIRPRGMNWNVNSMVGSVVSAVQTGVGIKRGTVDPVTGAAKIDGKMPGLTIGGRVKGTKGTLGAVRTAGRGSVGAGAKEIVKAGAQGKQEGGFTGGIKGTMVADTSKQQSILQAMGIKELSGGRQVGKMFGIVAGSFGLKLLSAIPGLGTFLVYGGSVSKTREKKGEDGKVILDKNGKPVMEKVTYAFQGLHEKMISATSNVEGATKAIKDEKNSFTATIERKETKDKDGNAVISLSYVDPSTGQKVEKTFTDSMSHNGPSAEEQASAELSRAAAPLQGALSFALQTGVGEKQAGYASAFEDLSKSEEASPEMKKQIEKMRAQECAALEQKLTAAAKGEGQVSWEDVRTAAFVARDGGEKGEGVSAALGAYVSSGSFDKNFSNTLQVAANETLVGDRGRIDATEVARDGLFVLGVAGHDPEATKPVTSEICADKIAALVGTKDNPGAIGNLISERPAGNPLIFSEGKEKLAGVVSDSGGVTEYRALNEALKASSGEFRRMEAEIAIADRALALDAISSGRQLTQEERNTLEMGAHITDCAAGMNLISETELRRRAEIDKAIDPDGQYKIPQSSLVSEQYDKAPKEPALYTAQVSDVLGSRYNVAQEDMAQILASAERDKQGVPKLDDETKGFLAQAALNRGAYELDMVRSASGQEPLQQSEMPKDLPELNRMRSELKLPEIQPPPPFESEFKDAQKEAQAAVSGFDSEDEKTRHAAAERILASDREHVGMFSASADPRISSLIDSAYPHEPSKTSLREAEQEKSSPDASRKGYAEEQARRAKSEEEFQRTLDSAVRPEQRGRPIDPFKTQEQEDREIAEQQKRDREARKKKRPPGGIGPEE